jgi:hypothetical protein
MLLSSVKKCWMYAIGAFIAISVGFRCSNPVEESIESCATLL